MINRTRLLLSSSLVVPVLFFGGVQAQEADHPIAKVEHFLASSTDAQALHEFLHQEFMFPEIWPFTNYGGFSSGGVFLGNVVFESIQDSMGAQGQRGRASFNGIALEPVGPAAPTLEWLDQNSIGHGAPSPFTVMIEGTEQVFWVTFTLEVPPATATIFVCDYTDRELIRQGREVGTEELTRAGGGPLGVWGVGEIILNVADLSTGTEAWKSLLGGERMVSEGLFRFSQGPAIRLEQGEPEGIREIVVEVVSLDDAKAYLNSKGILGETDQGDLTIGPSAVQGLSIRLRERNARD
ncbi:MAG: hypothetical protein PVJ76_19815 [Gemmatimonadota bacterium]|jgi:hypothetical protein